MMEFFTGLLNSAAPLMLAGLGALLSDLSGALGIFIEGFMITGAFFSWIFAGWTGSVFWGTAISALLAALVGWGLARFTRLSGAKSFYNGTCLESGRFRPYPFPFRRMVWYQGGFAKPGNQNPRPHYYPFHR